MNVHPELETLRDWLRFAVSRFTHAGLAFGHGSTNAYDEAVYLLLHALHLPLDRLEPFLDAHLTGPERGELAALLQRQGKSSALRARTLETKRHAFACRVQRGFWQHVGSSSVVF